MYFANNTGAYIVMEIECSGGARWGSARQNGDSGSFTTFDPCGVSYPVWAHLYSESAGIFYIIPAVRGSPPPNANVTFRVTETYDSTHNLDGALVTISNGQTNTTASDGTAFIRITPNSSAYNYSVTKTGYYSLINASLGSFGETGGAVNISLESTTPIAPVADFTKNATSGKRPLVVGFADASIGNISARSWDFGDGGSSTVLNPVHTFVSIGNYTVNLSVTGPGGSSYKTENVSANFFTLDFTANTTIAFAPGTIQFYGNWS